MKKHTPKQKASITLAALRGEKISKLSSDYQIHPNQIAKWKKTAEDEIESVFLYKRKKENKSKDRMIDELYKIIGQREVEISWLKKNTNLNYQERLTLINRNNLNLSLSRQTELLEISRSSVYYNPIVSETDIQTMNAIDEIYTMYSKDYSCLYLLQI